MTYFPGFCWLIRRCHFPACISLPSWASRMNNLLPVPYILWNVVRSGRPRAEGDKPRLSHRYRKFAADHPSLPQLIVHFFPPLRPPRLTCVSGDTKSMHPAVTAWLLWFILGLRLSPLVTSWPVILRLSRYHSAKCYFGVTRVLVPVALWCWNACQVYGKWSHLVE